MAKQSRPRAGSSAPLGAGFSGYGDGKLQNRLTRAFVAVGVGFMHRIPVLHAMQHPGQCGFAGRSGLQRRLFRVRPANRLAFLDRLRHLDLVERLRLNGGGVSGKDDEVGQLACLNGTFGGFLEVLISLLLGESWVLSTHFGGV